MSREERRAYQRQMRGVERGASLPPAAKARADRTAARRAARKPRSGPERTFTTRFWMRSILIAVAIGFVGFSVQWPNMPFALYVGLAVAGVVLALLVGFRLLQRRVTGLEATDRPPR